MYSNILNDILVASAMVLCIIFTFMGHLMASFCVCNNNNFIVSYCMASCFVCYTFTYLLGFYILCIFICIF